MAEKPAPSVTPISRPFWEGCAEGALLYQYCPTCSRAQFPPGSRCRACAGSGPEWRRSNGKGIVHSATRVHRGPTAAFQKDTPYTLALIDLSEGFRLLADVKGAPEAEGLIGQPVQITFHPPADGLALPQAEVVHPKQDTRQMTSTDTRAEAAAPLDAVIVGAGFAGLYMLHKLRELGLRARVVEAAGDVGGTWYWNRYPGARCDVESLAYSFSFSDELVRDWTWTERFATQPEILRYLEFVADRLDLRRDISFGRRVTQTHYAEADRLWRVATDRGDHLNARFCIMATGCLSEGRLPSIPGLETFKGAAYHTGAWPHEPVDFSGLDVGVIGTGSSGIQLIPQIAAQAAHTTVFQRTPSFSVPACNAPLDPALVERFRRDHAAFRKGMRSGAVTGSGDLHMATEVRAASKSAREMTAAEREAVYATSWERGGAAFMASFPDQMVDLEVNASAADFIRGRIREIVKDPATANALTPRDYPVGSKRICVDTDYYAAFNRENVKLVDLRRDPIVEVTPRGLRTQAGEHVLDAIVYATGFDAMTGSLNRIDIEGRGGRKLKDAWAAGPGTYLGLSVAGFPNLFLITGPGSPSVISNVVVSIEQHVEWIADCLIYMRAHGSDVIEAEPAAQDDWVRHVNEVADATLFPVANSWYVGANIPGKPRIFMPYVGGVGAYRETCDAVAADGYRGFRLS